MIQSYIHIFPTPSRLNILLLNNFLLLVKTRFISCMMLVLLNAVGMHFLSPSSATAEGLDVSFCHQAVLSQDLPLITSGVEHKSGLLLADAYEDKLVMIDNHGRVQDMPLQLIVENSMSGKVADDEWAPHQIHRYGNTIYVLVKRVVNITEKNQPWFMIIPYDENLKPRQPLPLPFYEKMHILDFEPGERGILLYGKFGSRDSTFRYYDFASTEMTPPLYTIPVSEGGFPAIEHYYYAYLNVRFMAALGTKMFILLFRDEGASILAFDVESKKTAQYPVPDNLRAVHRPPREFQRWRGWDQATYLHRNVVEAKSMAMGLYPSEDSSTLLLLSKDAIALNGTTSWWLTHLDAANGKVRSTPRIRMPTPKAAHVTIIPNIPNDNGFWKIIERDRVETLGDEGLPYTRTVSMTLMPSDWLLNPPKSLGGEGETFLSCKRLR